MPLVNVKVIENVFTREQKKQMIEKLTEVMVEIEGKNLRSNTLVIIEDVKEGEWAVGGKSLTAKDVHRIQRGEIAA